MLNAPVIVFALTIVLTNFLFTRWFIRYAKVKRMTDYPSERSSHERPTPRGGGVGFVILIPLCFLLYTIFFGEGLQFGILIFLIPLISIAVLGWFDDRKDLSRRIRLSVQIVSALLILFFLANLSYMSFPYTGAVYLGFAGTIMGLFWITGTTNIYNFMDGVDGISSVQSIFAALGWSIFFYLNGEADLFALNLFVIVGVGAFLMLNWPPAKIFMGDVGSLFLGFLFSVMPFLAFYFDPFLEIGELIWFAGILLWPFLFDGSYTIFRRLFNGENIFEAHRSHLYQKLNINGWSHKAITILYAVFSLICLVLSFGFYFASDYLQLWIIGSLILVSLLYAQLVRRKDLISSRGMDLQTGDGKDT
ncbi:MAG: glycosyltransferase family 4 protein [Balneolaceae bacterium]